MYGLSRIKPETRRVEKEAYLRNAPSTRLRGSTNKIRQVATREIGSVTQKLHYVQSVSISCTLHRRHDYLARRTRQLTFSASAPPMSGPIA